MLSGFKKFVFRGNVIDLAVAVVIGAAFGAVITSLVKNVIMPAVSYVTPGEGSYRAWQIGRIEIGAFIAEVINFLIIAAAIFLIVVKILGSVLKRAQSVPAPTEPTTRECPFCLSVIPIKARRCAHCTADLEGEKGTRATTRPT